VMALLMNPLVMRIGAIVLACVAVFGFGWFKGSASVQKQWDAFKQQEANHALQVQQDQTQATTKVVADYNQKQNDIKEKSNVIVKQIPVYLAGADCPAAGRIGLLISSAASGVPLPATAGASDVPATTTTELAEWSTDTIAAFQQNAEQLIALQEWIRKMQEVTK
jgi:hypothetical protein